MKPQIVYLLSTIFLLPFWEAIGGMVGYTLIAILSLGAVQGQRPEDDKMKFPWHGFARAPDGRIIVQSEVATIFGSVFLLLVVAFGIAWKVGAFNA
ncbi:hypothetical protein SCL_1923 [Sulfuricaulis limicola]|uniref:Uncharacterized protein n=1 Tax=Sulfuricaulis limicola TaxID=1620215 RepID=A0A1B4XHC1_9GAMM|nr:hypothetical protein [Sulfuricaulis limicola]BAV34214.1 hypothetical protein SCL_1923 [Sulfuricaulis limicola]